MAENEVTDGQMTTVTLAAHARRGLIMITPSVFSNAHARPIIEGVTLGEHSMFSTTCCKQVLEGYNYSLT